MGRTRSAVVGRHFGPVRYRRASGGRSEAFCAAPSSSLYLDQFGDVRACCQHTDVPLGNVAEDSLKDIWRGKAATRLRLAMLDHDLSLGCSFCQWQRDEGSDATVYARNFDPLRDTPDRRPWPRQLEFSISNSCNLQCAMCNGDFSSAIRSQREHRPPLPRVYPERFFDELAEILPAVDYVNVLGGEPLLSQESLRVMDLIAEVNPAIKVTIATNGTIWNDRVERLVAKLRPFVVVSLDGMTAETFESIRVGAQFHAVMANIDRFAALARAHGTEVSLAHCLMRSNWWEFADFLAFAERRGFDVGINTVVTPPDLSLFQLPAADLREVTAKMERRGAAIVPTLARHRHVWDDQIGALRNRADAMADDGSTLIPWHLSTVPVTLSGRPRAEPPG